MANFDTSDSKHQSAQLANNLLIHIRALYQQAKLVQKELLLYQSGADPVFNASIDALFTLSERQELNTMISQIDALVTNWETNHAGAIGFIS